MSSFVDWRVTLLVDGSMYSPPEGLRHSGIRVTEYVRPLEPVSALMRGVLAQLAPSTEGLVVAPPEPLVTYEGEHAVVVRVKGRRRGGEPIEYMFGFLYGDDFYTGIVAYCVDEAQFDAFRVRLRAFVLEYELRLGSRRARRFLYTPPAGWIGRARGLRALWYPPEFPRHPSRIIVAPAMPCESTFSELERELRELLGMRGFVAASNAPKTRISNRHGLRGWWWHLGDATREIVTATMLDDRFGYHLRLETDREHLAADRTMFERVVDSAQPIPGRSAGQADELLRAMTPA